MLNGQGALYVGKIRGTKKAANYQFGAALTEIRLPVIRKQPSVFDSAWLEQFDSGAREWAVNAGENWWRWWVFMPDTTNSG